MDRLLTTPLGYQRATQRLREVEAKYASIVASNPEAAEAGDNSVWHDNFAFEENQRQMHQWARQVTDLRALLSRMEVIEPPSMPDIVGVGCRMTFEDVQTRRRQTYVISGYDDGDIRAGRLSYNSPLGVALLGATVGECREVSIAGAIREVEILNITRAQDP